MGSNLASLAGAAWLAGRLRRGLLVDWRDMLELKASSVNYFTEFLESPDQILDVPVRYAPDDGIADYPEVENDACAWFAPADIAARAREGRDPKQKYAVVELYHGLDRLDPAGDQFAQHEFLRHFYREIRPIEHVRTKLAEWRTEHFGERFVVGVNIRTGNGQFVKGSPYHRRVDPHVVSNERALVRKVAAAAEHAIRRLPQVLRANAVTFYVTDSYRMHAALSRLPRSITRRTIFPPAGTGHQFSAFGASDHGDYTDRTSIEDTIIDMFLLADCQALVFNPTIFSQYARVTTNWFGGNQVNIESRYLRHQTRQARGLARTVLRRR